MKNPSRALRAGCTVCLVTSALVIAAASPAAASIPAWWAQTNVAAAADTAPANLGQLRTLTNLGKSHLDANLPGGAGPEINAIVGSYQLPANATPAQIQAFNTSNSAAINVGQLRSVAKLFFDRLNLLGHDTKQDLIAHGFPDRWSGSGGWTGFYPWDPSTNQAVTYTAATVGQLKAAFTFERSLLPVPVAVEQFGAKGDGVTDDRAAIQAAIDYALSTGINRVVFQPKTYKLSTYKSGLTSSLSYVDSAVLNINRTAAAPGLFEVQGGGATLLVSIADRNGRDIAVPAIFARLNPSPFVLRDLTVKRVATASAPVGVGDRRSGLVLAAQSRFQASGFVFIENCTFSNCHRAYDIGGTAPTIIDRVIVKNCNLQFPFGSQSADTGGGGQMSQTGPGVREENWINVTADGGNNTTLTDNRLPKDGAILSAAETLNVSGSTIKNYGVEGVYHVPFYATCKALSAFTVPPVGQQVTVGVSFLDVLAIGDRLYVPTANALQATTFSVVSFSPGISGAGSANGTLTLRNTGESLYNVAGSQVLLGQAMYKLSTRTRAATIIDRCTFDGTLPSGGAYANFSSAVVGVGEPMTVTNSKFTNVALGVEFRGYALSLMDGSGSSVANNTFTLRDPRLNARLSPAATASAAVVVSNANTKNTSITGNTVTFASRKSSVGFALNGIGINCANNTVSGTTAPDTVDASQPSIGIRVDNQSASLTVTGLKLSDVYYGAYGNANAAASIYVDTANFKNVFAPLPYPQWGVRR